MSDKLRREGRILKHAFQNLFFFPNKSFFFFFPISIVVFPGFDDKQDLDI